MTEQNKQSDTPAPETHVTVEPWNDLIFCRYDPPIWYVENPIEGALNIEFATKAEAEGWVLSQASERQEIERWARVIDRRLWAQFDVDKRAREGFMYDAIFISLRDAKRARDMLSTPSPGTRALGPNTERVER